MFNVKGREESFPFLNHENILQFQVHTGQLSEGLSYCTIFLYLYMLTDILYNRNMWIFFTKQEVKRTATLTRWTYITYYQIQKPILRAAKKIRKEHTIILEGEGQV